VQADLGSNFGGFDNFAWNNYAPDVEYDFGGDGTGVLYTSHYLLEDPGTGALWTSAQAWLESSNGVGSSVDLNVDLYHTSDHGEYQYRDVGGATFAYVEIGPVGPGHVSSDPTGQSGNSYTSDLSVSAEEWFADETTSSAYGSDTLMLAATPCSPVIQGILVDGVPTNGFVVGKIGTLTVTGQCLDNVSLVSFQSAPGLSVTGPFTVSPVAGATVVGLEQFTGTYTVAAGSAPSQGYMNVTTPNGVSGPYSPIVVAPSLPYVTSILANPIPWQAGSANNYFFVVGAGFGASPSVSVTLASGAQVGQVTLSSCAPVLCQDSVISGTVTIPAEATPDVATITVGYNGYGNGFLGVGPPAGGTITGQVPVTTTECTGQGPLIMGVEVFPSGSSSPQPTNGLMVGTSGTLQVNAACLDSSVQLALDGPGVTLGAAALVNGGSAVQTQFSVDPGAPLGEQGLYVSTSEGGANTAVEIVNSVPYIEAIYPDWWPAGETTCVTIIGAGFGGGGGFGASLGGVVVTPGDPAYGVNFSVSQGGCAGSGWSDTAITGAVTTTAGDPGQTVSVAVVGGDYGFGFQSNTGRGRSSPVATAQVGPAPQCADPQQTATIQEYVTYNAPPPLPACSWLTQTNKSGYFTFPQLTVNMTSAWALIKWPLTAQSYLFFGLDYWVQLMGPPQTINSAYRNPAHNKDVGGDKTSRHMFGDAVDIKNVTRTPNEFNAKACLASATNAHPVGTTCSALATTEDAKADWVEPLSGPCKLGCVHADWRNTYNYVYYVSQ
jgi:hypothetical protein